MTKRMVQKLLGIQLVIKQKAEIFGILDEHGLTVLFHIVGVNPRRSNHVENLHFHWQNYLTKAAVDHLTPKINELIEEDKNEYQRLIFEERYKDKPLPYTRDELIEMHINANSEEYQKLLKMVPQTKSILGNTGKPWIDQLGKIGDSRSVKLTKKEKENWILRKLSEKENKGRTGMTWEDFVNSPSKISKPDEYYKQMRERHLEKYSAPILTTETDYTIAGLLNQIGRTKPQYKKIKLGANPTVLKDEVKKSYNRKTRGSTAVFEAIEFRLNAMLDYVSKSHEQIIETKQRLNQDAIDLFIREMEICAKSIEKIFSQKKIKR